MNDLPASLSIPESALNSLVSTPETYSPMAMGANMSLVGVVSLKVADPIFREYGGAAGLDAICVQYIEITTIDGGRFHLTLHRVIAKRQPCEICGSTGDYTECAECDIPF